METLLYAGVTLVVITGTNAKNVSGQIAPLLSVAARQRLFLMVNRGSEVYAYDTAGELERLWLRTATAAEEAALDRTANGVRDHLAAETRARGRHHPRPPQPAQDRPDPDRRSGPIRRRIASASCSTP